MANPAPSQKYPAIVGGIDKIAANFFWLLPAAVLAGAAWWLVRLHNVYMTGMQQDPQKFYELVTNFSAYLVASLIAYSGLVYTVRSIKHNTSAHRESTVIATQALVVAQQSAEANEVLAKIANSAYTHSKHATTIEFIMDINKDARLQEAKNKIFQHVDDGKTLTSQFECCDATGKDGYFYALNKYEFFALGIRKGVFDEDLCKYLHCSSFIKLAKNAKPLIEGIRIKDGGSCFFQEILWLLNRWEADPIKPQ